MKHSQRNPHNKERGHSGSPGKHSPQWRIDPLPDLDRILRAICSLVGRNGCRRTHKICGLRFAVAILRYPLRVHALCPFGFSDHRFLRYMFLSCGVFLRQSRSALADQFNQSCGCQFPRRFQFGCPLMRFCPALLQIKQPSCMSGPRFGGTHLRAFLIFLKMIADRSLGGSC